ncbi:hypothetical protein A6E15_18350 [Natrinema saccharevitans]|uniref:Uncharacterized protein n=1 Tax=Natrinema saccharevitans TaxID=301967 RepID=A0A1S8ARA5_9EURY|nr:hypothetical protein [Natrinema saccharevitans]OLZ39343.1 hypothetical protein A6E15_18350 [Natrinema saccharevitans]
MSAKFVEGMSLQLHELNVKKSTHIMSGEKMSVDAKIYAQKIRAALYFLLAEEGGLVPQLSSRQ